MLYLLNVFSCFPGPLLMPRTTSTWNNMRTSVGTLIMMLMDPGVLQAWRLVEWNTVTSHTVVGYSYWTGFILVHSEIIVFL